jgi:hypothetical protein
MLRRMLRSAIAAGLLGLSLLALGCGGGSDEQEEPIHGVPLAGGRCEAKPAAAAERAEAVKAGDKSRRRATIEQITEVRTCEIERNLLRFKEKICSVEVAKARLEGKLSDEQVKALITMREKAEC